jgi:hypothetical protein
MKYYRYHCPSNLGLDVTRTLSEEQILCEYGLFWFDKMYQKYGKEYVDANFTSKDCIDDFVVVNWAYEVKGTGTFLNDYEPA